MAEGHYVTVINVLMNKVHKVAVDKPGGGVKNIITVRQIIKMIV